MQEIELLVELLEKSIKDEPENSLNSGNIIKDGFNQEIDDIRAIVTNSKKWLTEYQTRLIEDTGISSIRIKYTNVTGYFIEVSKSQSQKVPDYFQTKQTLVSGDRFTTIELKEFEKKLSQGEALLVEKEYEVFSHIRDEVESHFRTLKKQSEDTAFLDFLCSLSTLAMKKNYVRPKMHNGYELDIVGGRHPVIETLEKDFISNDVHMSHSNYVHIITGPNMGGKSTYLRQNALIVLLAHIGSFVPAKEARIPLTDKIFSRVGSQDNLFMGQSTFMVEMQEVANILNNSTQKSFVIIDEIGRGTSTYDGMSLAWAILKYNHDKIQAKTLFATHYHELVDESKKLPGVLNFSVAVGENSENLVFLRKIIPGAMKKSFGLEVASIAGVNKEVIKQAREMLKNLELQHSEKAQIQLSFGDSKIETRVEYIEKKSELDEQVSSVDVNNLTPLEAFNLIIEWKNKLGK